MTQVDWALNLLDFLFLRLALWLPILSMAFLLMAFHLEAPIERLLVGTRSMDQVDISEERLSVPSTDSTEESDSKNHAGWRVKKYLTHRRAYDSFVNIMYIVGGLLMLTWPWLVETDDPILKIAAFLVFLTVFPLSSIRDFLTLYRYPTIESRVARRERERAEDRGDGGRIGPRKSSDGLVSRPSESEAAESTEPRDERKRTDSPA